MNILSSKWFSLFCALLNVYFACQSFLVGNWFIFIVASAFAVLCGNNFIKALQ